MSVVCSVFLELSVWNVKKVGRADEGIKGLYNCVAGTWCLANATIGLHVAQ